jgi:hypothetical protein
MAAPSSEVGLIAPQARQRRALFTSAQQRLQISLATKVPLSRASFIAKNICWRVNNGRLCEMRLTQLSNLGHPNWVVFFFLKRLQNVMAVTDIPSPVLATS